MTNDNHSHALHPRPFEDGHALTYTIREIYPPNREYQSQHHDSAAAANAFMLACREAVSVELRDTHGHVLAAYTRGHGQRDAQGGAS